MALFKRKKRTDEEESQEQTAQTEKEGKKDSKSEQKKEPQKSMKDLYRSEQAEKEVKKDTKADSAEAVPEEKKEDKKEIQTPSGKGYARAYKTLVKPLVTEKISDLGELNKYAFEVSLDANKVEVAKSVKGVYGIEPEKVNIIKMKGKKVTLGRLRGRRKDWKKAIVTLPKGKTINVYEGL